MSPVPIEYFQRMQSHNRSYSKHSSIRKQPKVKRIRRDKDAERLFVSHCDLCNDELPKEADDIQCRINVLEEINDSYESEYDRQEPRLLLCPYCTKEYNIPSWIG